MILLKRAALIIAPCLACALWPASARADDETGVLRVASHKSYESKERFILEFRFGLYHPRVDTGPGLRGAPYESTFGDTANFEFALEFDWQAYRIPHFGTIGPGFGAGWTQASALAKLVTPQPNGQNLSAESTALTIFPMYGVAVVRADVLDKEAHIPLVPYAKIGFGWGLWRASNSAGTSVSKGGVVGEGTSYGLQAGLGLAFDLNVLDLAAARGFDNSVGVNHTYVFFEAFWADLGPFQSNALYVGAYTWSAGLALSF
jgi:hypothetical protein